MKAVSLKKQNVKICKTEVGKQQTTAPQSGGKGGTMEAIILTTEPASWPELEQWEVSDETVN